MNKEILEEIKELHKKFVDEQPRYETKLCGTQVWLPSSNVFVEWLANHC